MTKQRNESENDKIDLWHVKEIEGNKKSNKYFTRTKQGVFSVERKQS